MDEVMDTEDSSNQFSLNDFPDEILLKLMNHMNDTSLLNMTRTCHRFRAIAKEAFGNIYNGGKHGKYKMKILGENDIDEQKRYRPFFCTFGENIKAIEIASDDFEDFDRNHWVYNSMQKYCTSLTGLVIYYVSGVDLTKILLQQPCLTHLHLNRTYDLDTSWINHSFPNLKSFKWNVSFDEWIGSLNFDEFFDKNRQLIELSMSFYSEIEAINIIDSLNGKLKNLKMLELISEEVDSLPESTIIILDELEFLTLECKNAYAILGAISKGCKNIKKLKITFPGVPGSANVDWNAAVATICSLKKLTKLKMTAENIGVLHLQRIIDSLPDLTRLHLTDVSYKSNAFEYLPYIVASGTKLIELKVKVLPYDDIISLTSEFIKCMAELTQLNNSLKVMLSSDQDKFIFTRGEVRRGNSIIYFDNQDRNNDPSTLNLLNLNNSCLEKIVGLLDSKSQCELYKSCTKMQNIVKDYLSGHMFHATYKIDKNVFHSLGHHISRISMEQGCGDVYLILRRTINRYCSTITELILTVCGSIPDNPPVFVWPNLKTMIVKGSKISYQNLRSFMCPMLAHLEIRELEADVGALQAMDKFDHADAYRQLTTLMVSD